MSYSGDDDGAGLGIEEGGKQGGDDGDAAITKDDVADVGDSDFTLENITENNGEMIAMREGRAETNSGKTKGKAQLIPLRKSSRKRTALTKY